ncbi:MAG: octanoyltransferase [Porticoccaceae bacterium]|nr:MAG: octanoyltransferase [Porticoccaceae bacterium]
MDCLIVRELGRRSYEPVFAAMRAFTDQRTAETPDELWWVEHDPVYTLGQAGREEHLLAPGEIPVLRVDRGGQVTYHGPGQIVGYPLVDLRRRDLGVREWVTILETCMIDALAAVGIAAYARREAPGVYVAVPGGGHRKIGSLGIRVRRGASYHGLALNVDMDLTPFRRIDPCGQRGLEVTQVADLLPPGAAPDFAGLKRSMAESLARALGFAGIESAPPPPIPCEEPVS